MPRPNKPKTPFAGRLVLARSHMTRSDLAAVLGVPIGTLGGWEQGKNFPPAEILERLRDVLGVTLDWLISGEGEMHRGGDNQQAKPPLRPQLPTNELIPANWSGPILPPTDTAFVKYLGEKIRKTYQDIGAYTTFEQMLEITMRHYDSIVSLTDDPDQRKALADMACNKLRTELLSATRSTKHQGSGA